MIEAAMLFVAVYIVSSGLVTGRICAVVKDHNDRIATIESRDPFSGRPATGQGD